MIDEFAFALVTVMAKSSGAPIKRKEGSNEVRSARLIMNAGCWQNKSSPSHSQDKTAEDVQSHYSTEEGGK